MREGLGATELGVRGANWTRRRQDRTVPFKHDESGILISKPSQRGEGHHSVRADYDKASQAVTDTREAVPPTVNPHAIIKQQMSTIHADLDSIAVKGDH